MQPGGQTAIALRRQGPQRFGKWGAAELLQSRPGSELERHQLQALVEAGTAGLPQQQVMHPAIATGDGQPGAEAPAAGGARIRRQQGDRLAAIDHQLHRRRFGQPALQKHPLQGHQLAPLLVLEKRRRPLIAAQQFVGDLVDPQRTAGQLQTTICIKANPQHQPRREGGQVQLGIAKKGKAHRVGQTATGHVSAPELGAQLHN